MEKNIYFRLYGQNKNKIFKILNSSLFYAAAMFIPVFINFVSIPIIISCEGVVEWSIVVTSQSLAYIFTVVVQLGWNINGPTSRATNPNVSVSEIFLQSVTMRIVAFLMCLPIALVILHFLIGFNALSLLAFLGAYLTSLLSSWKFITLNKPSKLFVRETLPRTLFSVIGIALSASFDSAIYFLTFVMIGNLAAVILSFNTHEISKTINNILNIKLNNFKQQLILQKRGFVSSLAIASYANLPSVIIQVFWPKLAPNFNLIIKAFRFFVMLFLPLSQILQGYTSSNRRETRILNVALTSALIGSFSVSTIAFFALPFLIDTISQNAFSLSNGSKSVLVTMIFIVCLTQYLGLTELAILDKLEKLTLSTTFGAILGLPLFVAGSTMYGLDGAISALCATELSILILQIFYVIWGRRQFLNYSIETK